MAVFHMILVVGNGVESTLHVGAIFLLSFLHMIPAHCKSFFLKKKLLRNHEDYFLDNHLQKMVQNLGLFN